ncbi:uncharacterized protein NFIA_009380 [Aspergillus fischeri NRRL 181]|uniref:Uncharacterized protein n=1 Tax=Neosartorya fischeri (strain ATCC 1020 / DSM 3700 / CBS 544.65 / FGSC A1164 / JCM 1740 / NRRL 181 / WB 181) TaxID=331117 RepID=A1D1G5_NEOFI|nr:uncharacterized protein NFIA_009380 [Aspergillus fischeri NRRL 181]EAW22258.1 hypothetical protein NFIA_009380 [Aspergillus fischeri NRRL 181]
MAGRSRIQEHSDRSDGALAIPHIPNADAPAMVGNSYVGTFNCQAKYPVQRPSVPYGQQNDTSEALWFEGGYKECVGYLTEGRYPVFDKAGYALTNASNATHLSISPAVPDHREKKQRRVIHYSNGKESGLFLISSALDGKWLGPRGTLLPANCSDQAAQVKITFPIVKATRWSMLLD